ncbi:threonine/serine exporter family protein [Oscillospiraceae bacterium LTW-04]|nr:threonine/serine exporter family protein [Oscillospiraceae bacterium MB24-C1]
MNIRRLNDMASEIGFLLLTHGAEIHRVEDTICRIATAYGAQADVFAIPASLVVTITDQGGKTFTKTRRVYYRDINLDRVDALNALARRICTETPEEQEIIQALSVIAQRPAYTLPQQLLAAGLSSGAFAILFGGGLPEAVIATAAGILVRWVGAVMEKLGGGLLLNNIIGGAVSALSATVAAQLWPTLNSAVVTISTLMLLVPGLAMTNSMRDLIAGDLVTGVMKGTEATVIAAGIAIGVMCSLAVWRGFVG